ncbi:MAG TPA: bifunctional adenosylcobinamide kinase/adenosylcobinamide-phosphate guanylyltransferase [Candidatus Avamphibacillus sp.]|nr:bifunctional adenosylcobinamide kinase/adenosylcobinamide-phosphate guanylyltransferase [Candidatus Avamphibacillus sp.]
METGELIFITGGVRSGKSSFAETLAISRVQNMKRSLHYIATSKQSDKEMIDRIKRHQEQRNSSDVSWKTREQTVDMHMLEFTHSDIVLLDCLTVLLSNELFRDEYNSSDEQYQEETYHRILKGIDAILRQTQTLIIVSNEVLNEPLSSELLTKSYASLLGKLHQAIVKQATKAYLVEAGIPVLMKERCQV